jgi:hypothetical protein
MGEFDLIDAVVKLGREFRRRGMDSHAALLRGFYAELRRRQRARAGKGWDETMVLRWLALLRIPPFDHVHPVLPRGTACPTCGALGDRAAPATFVRSVWPGGSLCECRRCGMLWLNEEPEPRGQEG